jgi:hypothetical protein
MRDFHQTLADSFTERRPFRALGSSGRYHVQGGRESIMRHEFVRKCDDLSRRVQ